LDFANEFIDQIRGKKTQLLHLLERHEPNETESRLREKLSAHWHELPQAKSSDFLEFSVDSSSARRSLVNGTDVFIVRALMLGSNGSQFKKVEFDAMRGITDDDLASKLERILRDLIEIQIVVENCPESTDGLVLIDGNLYGRYTHLMEQIPVPGREHLPLLLFEAMQKMFEACRQKRIVVVGVSKSSKTRALSSAFLKELGHQQETMDIPDVEMLYRWKQGEKGFTTPLVLGDYAFRDEAQTMREEPEKYLRRYFRDLPNYLWNWGIEVIEKVPLAPAIAMFHMVPEWGEQPLRIDVPVSCLGMDDQILNISPSRFADSYVVEDVLKQLLMDRGGTDVYNALLYVVDREVRLSSQVVDTVYRSILGRELGISIEYDRSTRRFYR
jgi:hypothetical protein